MSHTPEQSDSPSSPDETGDDPWLDDPAQAGDGASYPAPDGEIHARTQTEQANEELQQENAETALDQPSDGSGGE
jgi:hypothetical protein